VIWAFHFIIGNSSPPMLNYIVLVQISNQAIIKILVTVQMIIMLITELSFEETGNSEIA
jgi:hypothetical protein